MRLSLLLPLLLLAALALPAGTGSASGPAPSPGAEAGSQAVPAPRAARGGGATRVKTFSGKRLRGGRYLFRLRGIAPRRIVGGALYAGSHRLRHVSARTLRSAARRNGRLRLSAPRAHGKRHGKRAAARGGKALAAAKASLRVRVDDQAPTAPGGLVATAGDSSATLSWTASTDNVGVRGYRVYRDGAQIASLSSSTRSYRATSLTNGATYRFAVRAYDKAGNLSPEASADVRAGLAVAADTRAPSAPGGLVATAGDASASLSWSPSTDDTGVVGYRVYRDGVQVGSPSGTSFAETGLSNGTTYSYAVRAIDAAGNLSASSALVAVTPVAPTGAGAPPAPSPDAGAVGGSLPARLAQSTGATYYVSTAGSDSNPGTQAAPWRTVQKALNTLAAGQVALVRGGTYAQSLTMTRAGTASAPITVRSYPGERPVIKPGSGATNNMPLQIGSGAAYVRFQGLTFEGANGPSTTNVYAWGSARDIELSDCESRGSQRQGFFSEKGTARIQLIGCYFHDNGGSGPTQLDHNVYVEGSGHAVLGSLLTGARNGYGIQVYPSSDHIVIAGNTITGNFRDGIVLGSDGATTTTDALIVNNIITNSRSAISTYWGGAVGSNNIARNNLAWGNSQTSFVGSGITYKANVVADPLYASLSNGDYRLRAGSPAIDVADGAYATPHDLDGVARPQSAGPDIGAYER